MRLTREQLDTLDDLVEQDEPDTAELTEALSIVLAELRRAREALRKEVANETCHGCTLCHPDVNAPTVGARQCNDDDDYWYPVCADHLGDDGVRFD